jgi:hypothetical protein
MNQYPDSSTTLDECLDEGMPCPADWPVCETGQSPLSVMAHTKLALREVLEDPSITDHINLALMRFPQKIEEEPSCSNGHYMGIETISGDSDFHVTPASASGWFQSGLSQVMGVPFSDHADDVARLTQWIDFSEHVTSTGQACVSDIDCGYGFCDGTCQEHYDPELRGTGYPSIGRSLFYASEYFRQDVFLDGRPCQSQEDCPVEGYRCNANGVCHDNASHCRKTRIVVISNSTEAVNLDTRDFFHPWVQAKRLAHGLECQNKHDCLNDSKCHKGVCTVESLPPNGFVCSGTGESCTLNSDDDDDDDIPMCGGEIGRCVSIHLDYAEAEGTNLVIAGNGNPIEVQVHVVDLQGASPHNQWISTYGAGQHHVVPTVTVDAIRQQIQAALTIDDGALCGTISATNDDD